MSYKLCETPFLCKTGVTIQSLATPLFVFFSTGALATSYGPFMPTHHYPTDRSFHLTYNFSKISSGKDFVGGTTTQFNNSNSTYNLIRHEFIPEFQANRKLSFGAKLQLDSGTLSNSIGLDNNKTSLSDQFIFMEFRAHDEVGSSLGFGTVIKFPGYKNTTLAELLNSDDPNNTVLIGDGQVDLSMLVMWENWFGSHWRMQTDFGYTYRADGYASQLPYMASIGFVTPKMDFALRMRGNLSLGGGSPNTDEGESIRDAFAQSDWALSPNPWVLILEPAIELWISAKWAINFQYSQTLMGNNSPSYSRFATGLTYRWSETINKRKRSFKEVPIWKDQDAGKFAGEESEAPERPVLVEEDPVFEVED